MASFSFWSSWSKPYKVLFQILLALFLSTVGFALAANVWGSEWAVSWEVVRTYEPIEAPIATVQLLLSEIVVPVEHYLAKEVFQGDQNQLPAWIYPSLAWLYFFFLSFFIAIVSTLPRFWYYFGMTVTAFMLVALRLEQLMVWNESAALLLVIVTYFSLSYYFHAIKRHVHLYKRIGSFFIVTAALLIILASFAQVSMPFSFIGSYGIVFPLFFGFLFILIVSHDILSGFLYVITSGNTGYAKKSLFHFLVISVVYLGWVLLTYLNNAGQFELDLIYLNATVLLSISALLGIWGFRNRSENIFTFLPFAPMGAFLYLILGILCFFTIGAMHLVANAPMLEVIEDAIIFSHLGIGFMFFIYIIGNFAPLLSKNLNVYKIQYNPKNLPYFTASLGGVILIGVLVARSQLLPYFQGFAGYYNGLGDLYLLSKQNTVSEQYYKAAKTYDYRNAKSNNALGTLARSSGDDAFALKYFEDAKLRAPLESTFVNIADIYDRRGRFFDALFTLRQGLDAYPKSDVIKNNLGILLSKTAVVDSSLYYLDHTGRYSKTSETNLLYALATHRLTTDFDSLKRNFGQLSYLPQRNNTLVNLNMQQMPLVSFPAAEINVGRQNMQAEEFTFWYEYAINQAMAYEANTLAEQLNELANDSLNAKFKTELLLTEALYLYYHHHVGKAFDNLEALAYEHASRAGYYNYILGVWALEQGAFQVAKQYLEKSQQERYGQSSLPLALALETSGDTAQAAAYWRLFANEGSPEQQSLATLYLMKNSPIRLKENSSDSLSFLQHYLDKADNSTELVELVNGLEGGDFKWQVTLDVIQKMLSRQHYEEMANLFAAFENKPLNERLDYRLKRLRLRYWLAVEENEKITMFLEDSVGNAALKGSAEWYHAQAQMTLLEQGHAAAEQQYIHLSDINPFYDQGIVASAYFFRNEVNDVQRAYNTLLNGVKINPYSATLQKAYILQCLSMHLTAYAESSLAALKQLVPSGEYEAFLQEYTAKKDSVEQALDLWE